MQNSTKPIKRQQGFTLIELVIVIVLLSVMAVSIATLFRDTTEGYMQAESRIGMASSARLALERVGREVREAMPNSIRVNGGNNCVEFVPIEAATRYTDLPTTSPGTTINVVEQDASTKISGLNTSNLFVMVIPLNTNEAYNAAAGHYSSVSSFSKLGNNETQVTISSNRFRRNSPQDRIFFVRQPVSFCVVGNNLNRYDNYGFNTSQPAPASMGTPTLVLDRVLLSSNGNPVDVFNYDSGSLNRSALLVIELYLDGRKEFINLEHEVHVRNFP
ncbi:PilW family protein [Pleionea mediterranea]|uniref:MSHA biogenesis protein MshO n=1 Tax=Pleionea mediterranea TaxID=523701 RepID=A0A316FWH1_9GAMM|nr:type II secretion system protein [Pleionea mediterranea]PWK52928.1 MSHA biogenesis protein MshO [Pleionea mediterranea]